MTNTNLMVQVQRVPAEWDNSAELPPPIPMGRHTQVNSAETPTGARMDTINGGVHNRASHYHKKYPLGVNQRSRRWG